MTEFRGFVPSLLGKISTFVQISAIGMILIASIIPDYAGYYLPTIYTLVAFFSVLSGIQYIFHVAKLMGEEKRENPDL
jgi:phosphatidylglycerophosphate synthase